MISRAALALVVVTGFMFFAAAAAWSDPPFSGNSISPAFIRLVGSTAGVPDSISGEFTVINRDIANNPIEGAVITVDLSGCFDLRIASDQLNPNYTVSCINRSVTAHTNVAGIATFTLLGNSFAAGSYTGPVCARIYADGVLLSSPTVAAFDLTGSGGISGADLSVWLGDLGSGTYRARSDFDGSGTLSGADFSVWLGVLGRQGSATSGTTCP